jgi:hypothetical protein
MSNRSPFEAATIVSEPAPSGRRGLAVVSALVAAALLGGLIGVIVLMSGDAPPSRNRPQAIELSGVLSTSTAVPSVTPTARVLGQTTVRPGRSTAFSDREFLDGEVVAVIWSSFKAADVDAQARGQRDAYQAELGLTLDVVDGDWFRSIRDGTIAVVYAGGFRDLEAAAGWCISRGLEGDGDDCFAVVLSDEFDVPAGRLYPSHL